LGGSLDVDTLIKIAIQMQADGQFDSAPFC